MEDLLLSIVKECGNVHKLASIKQSAQLAHDKLFRQHSIHRDPSYELRAVCLTPLQMSLDTRRTKFTTIALNGIHRVIRDERFYVGLEPEDDSLWLPAQLLRTTAGLTVVSSGICEDTIVNILRLFLAMACSPTCTLNGRLLIEILSRCGECWESGTRAIRAASLAAASQCIRTFCSFLKDEVDDVLKTLPEGFTNIAQAAAVYNEVIPVIQWLCSRLIEPKSAGSPSKQKNETHGTLFLTECILTLTTALPKDVQSNPHFTAFLWQKFCPTLAAALGSPGRVNIDKKFTYKDALHIIESESRGFFTTPGLEGHAARCIYLTSNQMLRIAGAHGSLRPMLEALFHRILLLPSPQNRAEPLRCVREIFKSPERLVDLSVILYPDKTQGQSCSDDMALFRLIIDAIEECATALQSGTSCENSLQSSVECIVALLTSLQMLCLGDVDEISFSNQVTEVLNNRYYSLREADYTGPLTYQSMARLPAPYRDAVAQLRQNGFETSSGSESDIEHHVGERQEVLSNGSGDTEGPEDENNSGSSDELSSRVENTGNWLWPHIETQSLLRNEGDCDRQHAREFAKSIAVTLVPKLLKLRTSVEVDESMQEFASSICQQNSLNVSDFDYNLTAINADGIYLATYSALLLAYQLLKAGHYDQREDAILIPLSEQQFVTSVQNAGVLVYLSSAWLCELYQCILATNPFGKLKKEDDQNGVHCSLIDMLNDAGGLENSQMMSEWRRLQSVAKVQTEPTARQMAAKKLARRLLTCCWESMVTVLGVGLGEIEVSKANKIVALSKKTLRVKRGQKCNGEALYALSLEGLHSAATLSNSLDLQHLAGKIINLIATNVCRTTGPRISASQALSMDVVLSGGLALGSKSAECWAPVFTVCRHVSQLEHELFSAQNPVNMSATNAINLRDGGGDGFSSEKQNSTFSAGTGSDKLSLTSTPIDDDDEMCIDVYSFLQAPLQNSNVNVASIIKPYGSTNDSTMLTQSDTAKVFCALSYQTENLFCDAAEQLCLPALCWFLKSLCRASRDQLYRNSNNKGGKKSWWPGRGWKQRSDSHPLSLLLHRVGDVTLRVFRSSRPLLHILKVWAITGPHLMDAACHRDRSISKRAIEYIHDVITAVLVEQSELPHFHFNEALLKPFENLLSMETCDIDVQDQIVACLYEIVEAHRTEIRSGWRPLFGTLRNARNRPLHINNVTDIFRVFLDSDNTLVFANAGLDCILCLLSYLEITGTSTNLNGNGLNDEGDGRSSEFLHDTLKFLERCSSILAFMYNMPKCPNLHSTYKIKGISYTHIIDANIPNSMENFTYFSNEQLQNSNEEYMISYRSLHIDKESITKLEELDKPSGVLKVWFLLLDGLTNSLIVCPISHQSLILSAIFKLFRSLIQNPGIDFGFYCINHLLIPMIQDWLRYVNKTQKSWLLIEKNFKHCCGMTTDLVVEFIEKSQSNRMNSERESPKNNSNNGVNNLKMRVTNVQRPGPVDNLRFNKMKITTEVNSSNSSSTSSLSTDDSQNSTPTKIPQAATLALKQLLLVLIECTAQSQESIARVGVSCLKHIILSTGYIFNEDQWMIACSAIHRACSVTIAPLRQLAFAFNEKSNSFYGDCATVKVTARRDSTIEEIYRVHALAQQVFLMDSQRDMTTTRTTSTLIHQDQSKSSLDDRSFSFLLYPINGYGQNVDNFVIRIPYRNLIVGLLANQMLLQLVAHLLLGHLKSIPSTIHSCIFNNIQNSFTKINFEFQFRPKEILIRCIRQYIISSQEFDQRPGLKFLIQKVSNIDYAANLYKQMVSSWIIYFLSLVDSYLNDIKKYDLSNEDLKYILDSCTSTKNQSRNSIKKRENFIRYLFMLQESLTNVCDEFVSCFDQNTIVVEESVTAVNSDDVPSGVGEETDDDKAIENHDENKKDENSIDEDGKGSEKLNVNGDGGGDDHQQVVRVNPFDVKQQESNENNQSVSPEIEQQRATSIQKDANYRKMALNQLVVASMELIKSLSTENEEKLNILLTPSIKKAFQLVQLQGNELKVKQF